MQAKQIVRKMLEEHGEVWKGLGPAAGTIQQIGEAAAATLKNGNKILACGNGGSASQADHLVGEIVGRFLTERKGLPAISLTNSTATLTAVANDYGFEQVFSRQVEALGAQGDLLIALSTSGNSPNVIAAVDAAKKAKIARVALTGGDGGKLAPLCDHALVIESDSTPRIQEMHILAIHIICGIIDGAA